MQNEELQEFENDKEILFDFFSHVEKTEHAGETKYEPIFRIDTSFDRQLKAVQDLYPEEFKVYLKYILDDRVNIGLTVNKDTNLIEEISPELDEIQRLRILQAEKREKIISDKTALFSPFEINNDYNKLDDILFVKKSDFISCVNFGRSANRVNDEAYKELYLKNLKELLTLIKSNGSSYFKEEKDKVKSIGYTMEDFDKYMQEMLAYHFEIKGGTPDQYKPKPFAGLDKDEIKDLFVNNFKPEIDIEIDEVIHINNHKAIIDKFSNDRALSISNLCDESATNVLNNARDLLKNAKEENKEQIKINTLLNVRELYLTQNKIFYSYNIFKRLFSKSVKEYNHRCDKIYNTLKEEFGIDKKTIKKFLNNKTKVINHNGKRYDYEKIYNESKYFNNQLKEFDNNYIAVTKNSIKTDLNDNLDFKIKDNTINKEKDKTLNK